MHKTTLLRPVHKQKMSQKFAASAEHKLIGTGHDTSYVYDCARHCTQDTAYNNQESEDTNRGYAVYHCC